MSVYKQFSPKDYAVVPFNAHKQYNFDSSSALLNNVNFFNTKYHSGSIDTYSTSSTLAEDPVVGELHDAFDNVKYSQLDHLFYKNYITDISNKFGDIDYLQHHRTLYERCTIISVPTGLYGHKIKPGSLEFEAGGYTFKDDSYGNLIVNGINTDNFVTDPRLILLDLGPVKGFKRYDLNTYNDFIENYYYKKGQLRVNNITSYNTPLNEYEYDDSYFLNKIYYYKVNFSEADLGNHLEIPKRFPAVDFIETGSEIKIQHIDNLDFNKDNNYTIEFFIKPAPIPESVGDEGVHFLSKSTFKTIASTPSDYIDTPGDSIEGLAENQYPFKIYLTRRPNTQNFDENGVLLEYVNVHFSVSDGEFEHSVQTYINANEFSQITCIRKNNSISISKNGGYSTNTSPCTSKNTNNTANIYIGGSPNITSEYSNNSFSGSMCNLKIYDTALSYINVSNHFSTKNSSPYVGNIFYSHGLISITHPAYISQYGILGIGQMTIDDLDIIEPIFTVGGVLISNNDWLKNIKFQGSHLIYENEYKCTINENEYNNTLNLTVRKNKSLHEDNLANFATGSLFKPYITTVGLYNENNELLVVGKLGQPIRTSNETDTTLIVRWDT